MKRIISALFVLAILVPIFNIGGTIYQITILILGLIGLKEFLDIKETKKELPAFVKFIAYIIFTLFVVSNNDTKSIFLSVDYRVIATLLLAFLMPTVLYHEREKYSVNDAFFLIGGIFFLSAAFKLLIFMRFYDLKYLVYLFLITILTDTFALYTGMLVGKNKLLEEVSPKKTWEGFLGGTFISVILSSIYYVTVINSEINIFLLIIITIFLSILGQFGDLLFSAIKRYYGKKDFSNLIPGHGGILDRFDSIIFVLLGFMFFIEML